MSDAEQGNQVDLLRQQTTLARFGELALKSDDLEEILTEACRLAGEALGTDLAKVVELQQDGQTLLVRAGVGWGPGVVGTATIEATEDTSEAATLRNRSSSRRSDKGSAESRRAGPGGAWGGGRHRREGAAALDPGRACGARSGSERLLGCRAALAPGCRAPRLRRPPPARANAACPRSLRPFRRGASVRSVAPVASAAPEQTAGQTS